MELPGRPCPGQQPHDQSQVVSSNVDEVALLHVLPPAQPNLSHAAAIEDQRKPALHQFSAQLERLARNAGKQSRSIVVDRPARDIVAVPTREFVAMRLGNARLPRAVIKRLQRIARVVSLVGDQLGGRLWRRFRVDRGEMLGSARQRARHGRGVALVGGMHLGRNHRAGSRSIACSGL